MKLVVGMYVRYSGVIKKIKELVDFNERECKLNGFYINKKIIQNASYNIIDLIEIGDYVNGERVGYIDDVQGALKQFYYFHENPNIDIGHWSEEIQSVLTKEQFESMEYRIGE